MSNGTQTQARATTIATLVVSKMMGVDIAIIIAVLMELLPIIIDCFDPDDGPQAQEYVLGRYTEADSSNKYRGYDKRLVKATARRAKQAGRRTKNRITWTQAYELAFAVLDDIRTGDAHQASLAITENKDFVVG
jgi:hypothetical protein